MNDSTSIERWRGSVDAKLTNIEIAIVTQGKHLEELVNQLKSEKQASHFDFEKRLRTLEQGWWMLLGVAAVISVTTQIILRSIWR